MDCLELKLKKIFCCLLDDTTSYSIYKVSNWGDGILKHSVTFFQSKKVVNTYKVPNISTLYGRSYNCNPYLLTNINSNIVLMEVTKDYVKNNDGDYYFLAKDLNLQEADFFDGCYVKLECDYVYSLSMNENIVNKKKCKKKL